MASKAEKRLARRGLKLEKDLSKSARQFAEPDVGRTISETPGVIATKAVAQAPVTPHQQMMRLDRSHEDCEESWSWGQDRKCLLDSWDDVLGPFFDHYVNKKRWGEIDSERTGKGRKRRQKHVYYAFEMLVEEAYERLVFLEMDDFAPNVFRFRLSGKRRVFGFRIDATATFFTLWYDSEHRIYKN